MGAGQGRNRRGIILLLVVLVVLIGGGIAAVVLFQVFGGPGGGTADGGGGVEQAEVATETPTLTPTPPIVRVIAANRDIARGTRLTINDVTIVAYPDDPNNPLPPSLLTVSDSEDEDALSLVEDRVARVDIINGEPIHDFMLTPGEEPTDLADTGGDAALKIPAGFVAITVPFTRPGMVDYLVREGDHVDILASYRFVDVDQEFQTELPNRGSIFVVDAESGDITTLDVLALGPPDGEPDSLREEDFDPLNSTLVVVPGREQDQRPRQTTQLIISNAIVLQVGLDNFLDIYEPNVYEPIVVTEPPPATATPIPEDGEAPPEQEQEPTPTLTPVPPPLTVTLVMSRQDALVLKYSLEIGADLDLVLRSFLDDNITDVATDSVTLEYVLDVYGVERPPRLDIASDPRIDLRSFGDTFFFVGADEGFFGEDGELDPDAPPGEN